MKGIWDYIHNTSQIPAPLQMAFHCQTWHTLPKAGGYLDQPAKRMKRMEIALTFYNGINGYLQARNRITDAKEWIKWQRENESTVSLFSKAAKVANGNK